MATNKDARIQFKQATYYIELLEQNGTLMSCHIPQLEIIFSSFSVYIFLMGPDPFL